MKNNKRILITILKVLASIFLYSILLIIFLSIKSIKINVITIATCLIITIITTYYYIKESKGYYYNLKHETEMKYFDYLKLASIKKLKELNKKELATDIFKISNKRTYMEKCLIEALPSIIVTLIITAIIALKSSIILFITLILLTIITFIVRYKTLEKKDINYRVDNEYLIDFINKIDTIRKLNVFSFAHTKLEENKKERYFNYTFKYFLNIINIIIYIVTILTIILVLKSVELSTLLILLTMSLEYNIYILVLGLKSKKEYQELINIINNKIGERKSLKRISVWKTLSIKNGLFKYDKSGISINIPNLEIERLDQISIMGKSGEGKSSILKVLSGLYDLTEGEILIDKEKEKYETNYVLITPNIEMFNLSLRENLSLGTEINDKKLKELIKEIGLDEWVKTLPNKLDTIISNDIEKEIKEKINLIRAIILDADIYLLDNPTSHMELDSEKKITAMIKKYLKDKTFIIVTHRPVLTTICKKHYFIKEHTLMEKEPLL